MEQTDYNLMFPWFVGLGIDDPVWVPTVLTKNRDRLLTTDMSRKVMAAKARHSAIDGRTTQHPRYALAGRHDKRNLPELAVYQYERGRKPA